VRWCSASLKIDVCTKAINNTPRLKEANVLLVTGERGQESSGRAKYAHVEAHKSNTKRRTVHQWHSIQDWTEEQVWGLLEHWRINPHPAYHLGYGRVSCAHCIFGNDDQWATGRELLPTTFNEVAQLEADSGKTIHRKLSVVERADKGQPYQHSAEHKALALSTDYPVAKVVVPSGQPWVLPSGAYKRCGGPQ